MAPHLALVAVQVMVGTWPIIGKVALRSISSTSLVSIRVFGAALVFSLLQRKLGELRRLPKRVLAWLVLSSLLGVVLNQSEDVLEETHYHYGYYNYKRLNETTAP